jgi:ABC-type transport system involved in cytochrome bd biosynthesis fused ATPase/permease subunit
LARAQPPRGELVRALVAGFVASATNVALFVGAVALLVDSATRPGLRAVAVVLVVIELFAFLRSPVRFAERLAAHRLGYAAVTHWRSWLVLVVGAFDYSRWRRYASGDLLERALADTDQLQDLWLRFVIPSIDTLAVLALGDVVVAVLPPHGHWWSFVLVLVLSQALGVLALAKLATIELRDDRALRAARGSYRAQLVELSAAAPALVLLGRAALAEDRLAVAADRLAHAETTLRRHRRGSNAVVVVASLVALAGVAQHPRTSSVWLAVAAVIGLATYDALVTVRAACASAVEVSGGGERLEGLASFERPRSHPWPPSATIRLDRVALVEDGRRLLTDASLTVEPGTRVAIVGESGIGKSTLLRAIAGLDTVAEGDVLVGEVAISSLEEVDLRRHLAYVASEPGFTRGYALDVLTLGRAGARDALGDLATLGVLAERTTRFETLSRGEDARVALARALFVAPAVVVLDEPTAGLGRDETRRVLDLLDAVPATVIVATHDQDVVAWCDVVVELRAGALELLRR